MRSRDGNNTFSLSICSIILFFSTALNADEYLISYQYTVKDATLYHESLLISKAMKKCMRTDTEKSNNSLILQNSASTDLRQIISNNSEKFIAYIHKLGLHVEHKETTINSQNRSTTILTLKTTCFKVDFNDNFVRMSPLN